MMLAMSHCHSKVKEFVRAVLAGGFDRRREAILDPWERECLSLDKGQKALLPLGGLALPDQDL